MTVAWRIARRELRGGLAGFWIFLWCLTLGVGAIAAVGSVRAAIAAGLSREGAVLLGGDAELRLTYRFADADERAWMESRAARLSEVVDFRSMAVAGPGGDAERAARDDLVALGLLAVEQGLLAQDAAHVAGEAMVQGRNS